MIKSEGWGTRLALDKSGGVVKDKDLLGWRVATRFTAEISRTRAGVPLDKSEGSPLGKRLIFQAPL